jgi:prepilin-type N-terminal cleavage/methylation domain-containing protein
MRSRGLRSPARRGFTLIELLVVMTIILVLAVIGVLFAPRLGQKKAQQGADQVQQALLIAKSRALRDQRATGLRFLPDPAKPGTARELIYIQQPDDLTGDITQNQLLLAANNSSTANFQNVDFLGGGVNSATFNPGLSPVQPGDYLVVQGGAPYLILGVPSATQLQLQTTAPQGRPLTTAPTSNWRIIRSPRPLLGEDSLLLPTDVILDLSLSLSVPVRQSSAEILFAPSGAVVGAGTATNDKIVLFVRDGFRDNVTDGEPVLVLINVLSGKIGAVPVDPANYYSFTTDPRAGGM